MIKFKNLNMKSVSKIICFLFVNLSTFAIAQGGAAKFGYVDTDYILSQIPEYKAAQSELDKTSVQWQKEIEGKYSEIDKLYKIYQAESVLLTDDMKKKRENEIINKEKESRLSLNIRYKNLFAPLGLKDSLRYFSILKTSPLTNLGLDFQLREQLK